MTGKYAIVTGGSTGMGAHFCMECAKRGYHIIIAALAGNELEETVSKIKNKFPVEVISFPCDLSKNEEIDRLFNFCNDNNLKVNLLINNVGMGYQGRIDTLKLEYIDTLLSVNIKAMTRLTMLFRPILEEHAPSRIINLSSLASFFPLPYKSFYAASKAYVRSVSLGLEAELMSSNISVHVVCPGPVKTNQTIRSMVAEGGLIERNAAMEADDVAQFVFKKIEQGKTVIIPGKINKVLLFLTRVTPKGIRNSLLRKRFESHKI